MNTYHLDLKFWQRVALATFVALCLACLIVFFSPSAAELNSYGDFPAFYSAARLQIEGRSDVLYDQKAHQVMQNLLLRRDLDAPFLMFSYPPFYALLLAPLGFLNFESAYYLYSLLMFVCLIFSARNLSIFFDLPRSANFWLVIIAFISYPVFRSITGGQNSALSLLILTLILGAIKQNRNIATGIYLGLLFFKAQFAVPLLLWLLTVRHWSIMIGLIPTLLALYLAGLFYFDYSWPIYWLSEVARPFALLDLGQNAINSVTIKAQFYRYFAGAVLADYVSYLVRSVLFIATVIFLRKYSKQHALLWSLITIPLLLLAEHSLYYDLTLLVTSLCYFYRLGQVHLVVIVVCCTWLEVLTPHMPVQPSFMLILFLLYVLLRNKKNFLRVN